MTAARYSLSSLAGAARMLAVHASADAAEYRDLARAAAKRGSTHVKTRRTEVASARRRAKQFEHDADVLNTIAARLAALIPATAIPGKVPRGWLEFRVYLGRDHEAHWRALRGSQVVAAAHGYDRQRDGVRSVRRLVEAVQTGKFVITTSGKR